MSLTPIDPLALPLYLVATAAQWADLRRLYAVHTPGAGQPFIILTSSVRVVCEAS